MCPRKTNSNTNTLSFFLELGDTYGYIFMKMRTTVCLFLFIYEDQRYNLSFSLFFVNITSGLASLSPFPLSMCVVLKYLVFSKEKTVD